MRERNVVCVLRVMSSLGESVSFVKGKPYLRDIALLMSYIFSFPIKGKANATSRLPY